MSAREEAASPRRPANGGAVDRAMVAPPSRPEGRSVPSRFPPDTEEAEAHHDADNNAEKFVLGHGSIPKN